MPPSRRRSSDLAMPFAIERAILTVRGQRVMIDADLASLYGVTTKALNQALKRNRKRFPADFVFQLTRTEKRELVTDCDRFARLKHSTALPNAFTEHGAVMAATILNSDAAVRASVFVVRAFIGSTWITRGRPGRAAEEIMVKRQLLKLPSLGPAERRLLRRQIDHMSRFGIKDEWY